MAGFFQGKERGFRIKFMAELRSSFEKKEFKPSVDFLADQVSKQLEISKAKISFLEACDEVFERFKKYIPEKFEERFELKRKISRIFNKRRAHSKQAESPIEPKVPVKYNFRQEREDRSIENAVANAPLFEEEIRKERRHFN